MVGYEQTGEVACEADGTRNNETRYPLHGTPKPTKELETVSELLRSVVAIPIPNAPPLKEKLPAYRHAGTSEETNEKRGRKSERRKRKGEKRRKTRKEGKEEEEKEEKGRERNREEGQKCSGNLCDSETNVALIKGNSKRFLVKAARRLERKGRSNGSV